MEFTNSLCNLFHITNCCVIIVSDQASLCNKIKIENVGDRICEGFSLATSSGHAPLAPTLRIHGLDSRNSCRHHATANARLRRPLAQSHEDCSKSWCPITARLSSAQLARMSALMSTYISHWAMSNNHEFGNL